MLDSLSVNTIREFRGVTAVSLGQSARRQFISYFIALISGAIALAPNAAHGHTLLEALALTYQNNANLAAARQELRATDEGVNQALAPSRPRIELSGSKSLSDTQTRSIATLAPPNYLSAPTQVDVKVTQDLWRGGRTDVEERAAIKQVYAARAGLVAVEENVLFSAVSDYANVFAAQQVLKLNMENEDRLRGEIAAIRVQLKISTITKTDLAQAEAALSRSVSTLAAARGQLRSSEATYLHDVGELPGILATPVGIPVRPVTRDEATELAEQDSPRVKQAAFTAQAADDQIEAKRRELLPTISIVGEYNMGTQAQTVSSRIETKQIMAQISIPLFDGGLIASQSRAYVAVRSQRESQLLDARQAAVEAAQQAWDGLDATRQGVSAMKEEVRLQELAVEGVRAEQSLGTRRIYELLNQQQSLFEARVNLVQSQRDEVIYQAALDRAVGALTAQGIGLPVQDYDPQKNFDAIHHAWRGWGTSQTIDTDH